MKNYKLQKLWKILKPYIKMEKTIIKLGDIKSKKQKNFSTLYRSILIDNTDVNKIVVSIMNDFKYIIGYKNAKKNRPLLFLPKNECI